MLKKELEERVAELEKDSAKARVLLLTCRRRMKDTFFLTREPSRRVAGLKLMDEVDAFLETEPSERWKEEP